MTLSPRTRSDALMASLGSQENVRRAPMALAMIGILTLAAFGPYTQIEGVRTEQIAVYGMCAVLVLACRWRYIAPTGPGIAVAGLIAVHVVVGLVGAVWPVHNTTGMGAGSAAAGIDRLLLPLAVLAVAWMLAGGRVDAARMVRVVLVIVTAAMCANSAFGVMAVAHDLTSWLATWWDNTGDEAVAVRAAQLGRYSGIFNQPAEAGQMYSIAMLGAIHLLYRRPLLLSVTMSILMIGGTLTVSKIFLLVGLPVVIWQLVRITEGRVRRLATIAMVVGVGAVLLANVGASWSGAPFMARLFAFDNDARGAVNLYTAGRFGGDTPLWATTTAVLDSSPFFGFGAAGLAVPYDNAMVEALVTGGLVGAVCHVLLFAALIWAWRLRRREMDSTDFQLTAGLLVVLAGASIGLPALTANRVATITWLLLGLLLLTDQATRRDSLRPSPGHRPESDLLAPAGTRERKATSSGTTTLTRP
jgi:hypothetical protein